MKRCVKVDDLLQYWMNLCGKFAIPDPLQRKWWEYIVQRYNEPQRAYHTMRHLQELRYNMITIEDRLEDPVLVGFTLFFHDVIYDPTAKDNEDQSAADMRRFAEDCWQVNKSRALREDFVKKVDKYIMQTKNHMSCPTTGVDSDLLHFLDLDLAILAADRERYGEYTKQVRQEYIHYPDDAFRTGRSAVLNTFLRTDPIYKTEYFRDMWEKRAKENMLWEIALLKSPSLTSRKLTIGDKNVVANFERKVRRSDVFTIMRDEEIEHAIAMNYSYCLCFRDRDTDAIIAHVLTTLTSDDRYSLESRMNNDFMGDHLLIHSIAVSKDYRRQGVGTSLLKELITSLEQADNTEIKRISLVCPPHLAKFFEINQFSVVDEEVPFVQGLRNSAMFSTGSAGGTFGSQTSLDNLGGSSPAQFDSLKSPTASRGRPSVMSPTSREGRPVKVGNSRENSTSPSSRVSTPAVPSPSHSLSMSTSRAPKHTVMVEMSRAVGSGGTSGGDEGKNTPS